MGASKGIGHGIAAALAREGARVAIASRSLERLRAAATEIDGEVDAFEADTADLERLARLPGEVEARFGPVEILVTNTGGPPLGRALDPDLDAWERLPLAGPGAAGPDRGGVAGDARARLGADRQRRLELDPRADRRASPSRTPTGWRRSGS